MDKRINVLSRGEAIRGAQQGRGVQQELIEERRKRGEYFNYVKIRSSGLLESKEAFIRKCGYCKGCIGEEEWDGQASISIEDGFTS